MPRFGAGGEVLADGVTQDGGLLRKPGRPVEMDDEGERGIAWQLPRPLDDELLRVRVEVPLAEGRGIDRVEELLQLRDVHLDRAALRRDGIAGGWLRLVHASSRTHGIADGRRPFIDEVVSFCRCSRPGPPLHVD